MSGAIAAADPLVRTTYFMKFDGSRSIGMYRSAAGALSSDACLTSPMMPTIVSHVESPETRTRRPIGSSPRKSRSAAV